MHQQMLQQNLQPQEMPQQQEPSQNDQAIPPWRVSRAAAEMKTMEIEAQRLAELKEASKGLAREIDASSEPVAATLQAVMEDGCRQNNLEPPPTKKQKIDLSCYDEVAESSEEEHEQKDVEAAKQSDAAKQTCLAAISALSDIARDAASHLGGATDAHGKKKWIWKEILPPGTHGRREPWRSRGGSRKNEWGNEQRGNGPCGNEQWGNEQWGNGPWGNGPWGNEQWGNEQWGNGPWGNETSKGHHPKGHHPKGHNSKGHGNTKHHPDAHQQYQMPAAFQQGIPKLSSASSSAAGPTDTTAGPSAPSQFAHGAEEHWHQQWGGGNLEVLIHYDTAKSHIALRWMFEQSHIQYLRPRSESAFDA